MKPLHKSDPKIVLGVFVGFIMLVFVFTSFNLMGEHFNVFVWITLAVILFLLYIIFFREKLGLLGRIEFEKLWSNKRARHALLFVLAVLLVLFSYSYVEYNKFVHDANLMEAAMEFSAQGEFKEGFEICDRAYYLTNKCYSISYLHGKSVLNESTSRVDCDNLETSENFPFWYGLFENRYEASSGLRYSKKLCYNMTH